MIPLRFSIVAVLFLNPGSVAVASQRTTTKKPNVVILFADNLAYNDVGAFRTTKEEGEGGEEEERSRMPRTDLLAKEGLKLRHWNSPAVLCSASRAALLTGKYPVRTGVYPRVFEPDAELGLLGNKTVRQNGYPLSAILLFLFSTPIRL